MNRFAWAAMTICLGGLAAGCSIGSGSGQADGSIFEYGCIHDPDHPDAGGPYNLAPVFFAGEPIEDLSVNGTHTNEMRIRMQNNGLAIQYADALYFDVINSYEVARCVRGRIDPNTGQPDWKVTELLPDGTSTPWCDWSGATFTDGGAVDASSIMPGLDAGVSMDGGMSVMAKYSTIHLTPYTDVRSSFATLSTCGITNISAVGFDGWISFEHFGSAEEPDLAPTARQAVPGNFVIQFGDRMRARFHDVLGDQILITSKEMNVPPPRAAEISGVLDGYFDFNLERGRSAQPFP